jgi:hypothetical protein
MTNEQRMVNDVGVHFINKLHQLMTDCADTCARGGMKYPDTIGVMMTMLLYEAAVGARSNGLSLNEFKLACSEAYRLQSGPKRTA